MTRRALLEDPRLPTPVMPPETLYLELTVGQMSAQETTLFEFPCIGDDLNERDRNGDHKFTLDLLRTTVDQCSNPPAFRGVKTPITPICSTKNPSKAPETMTAKEAPKAKTTRASSSHEQRKNPKPPKQNPAKPSASIRIKGPPSAPPPTRNPPAFPRV